MVILNAANPSQHNANYAKPTITRDIQHLKAVANQLITSLARDSLALWYKDLLDDTNKARLKAWSICNNTKDEQKQLNALKLIIISNESIFNLLQQGPAVMSLQAMETRLTNIEGGNNDQIEESD